MEVGTFLYGKNQNCLLNKKQLFETLVILAERLAVSVQ